MFICVCIHECMPVCVCMHVFLSGCVLLYTCLCVARKGSSIKSRRCAMLDPEFPGCGLG